MVGLNIIYSQEGNGIINKLRQDEVVELFRKHTYWFSRL